jgi:predicted alpha/beta-fold hydrolase
MGMSSLLAGLFAGNFKTFPEKPSPPSPASPRAAKYGYAGDAGDDVLENFLKNERPPSTPTERPDMSNTAEMSVTLPLNLCRIADAVAANPRSPVLTDMALAVFVRHAIEAQRTIERLPAAAKAEALAHCREVENRIVAAITGHDYEQAYALASALPGDLSVLTPQ